MHVSIYIYIYMYIHNQACGTHGMSEVAAYAVYAMDACMHGMYNVYTHITCMCNHENINVYSNVRKRRDVHCVRFLSLQGISCPAILVIARIVLFCKNYVYNKKRSGAVVSVLGL